MATSSIRRCTTCQACWIDTQLFWSTGAPGNELDLAGLICNTPYGGGPNCANPAKGKEGGDTWAKREEFIRGTELPGNWGLRTAGTRRAAPGMHGSSWRYSLQPRRHTWTRSSFGGVDARSQI